MKNILKIELKRAFLDKKNIFLILLGVIIHIYSLLMWEHGILFFDFSASDINIEAAIEGVKRNINKYIFWHHGMDLYTVFMPLLSCLPYSTSLAIDRKSTFINYIITRTKKRQYLTSKIIANALVGGFVLAVPSLIFYLSLTVMLPSEIFKSGVHPVGFMSDLFIKQPEKYIAFTIMIEFLFGATYATFSLAISKFTENIVIIILTPFVYWYIGTFILERLQLIVLSPAVFNAFMVRTSSSLYSIVGQAILISGVSVCFILKKEKSNYERRYNNI